MDLRWVLALRAGRDAARRPARWGNRGCCGWQKVQLGAAGGGQDDRVRNLQVVALAQLHRFASGGVVEGGGGESCRARPNAPAFPWATAHQHLDPADHADVGLLLLLQPGESDPFTPSTSIRMLVSSRSLSARSTPAAALPKARATLPVGRARGRRPPRGSVVAAPARAAGPGAGLPPGTAPVAGRGHRAGPWQGLTTSCTAPAGAAGDRPAPGPPSPPPSARRGAAHRGRGGPWRPGWWRCLRNRSSAAPCGSWRWA